MGCRHGARPRGRSPERLAALGKEDRHAHGRVKIVELYPKTEYKIKQAVGVDTSKLFVARTGIRGSNDLVWVGRAANYAAKLSALRDGNSLAVITKDVFDNPVESWHLDYVQPENLRGERSGPMSLNELLWLIGKDK